MIGIHDFLQRVTLTTLENIEKKNLTGWGKLNWGVPTLSMWFILENSVTSAAVNQTDPQRQQEYDCPEVLASSSG